LHTSEGKNMVEIVKFVYVIIIFISLFLIAKNVEGKPVFSFFNSLRYFLHNILSHSSNIHLLSFFVTTGRVKCIKDYGCQNKSCQFPLKPYIPRNRVTCKDDSGCELKLCKLPLFPKCLKPYFLFLSTKEGFCACNWAMCP